MRLPLRARRAPILFLACSALLFAATTSARADDVEQTESPTVVVTQDGTHTVRLVQGEDGEFVLEPAHGQADPARARMHVVIRKDGENGEVRVLELRDGQWVAGDRPVRVEREVVVQPTPAVTTTSGGLAEGRNPMSTMLRWLLTNGMAGELPNDPLQAWFEGGANVPMAGLRDALKADGWTAQSLQAWFLEHLVGGMAALHAPAPHAMHPPMHPPMRGRWYELGRGRGGCGDRCDCDRGGRMEQRSPGRAWHGSRQGRGNGRGQGRRQAGQGGFDRRCGTCDPRGSRGACQGDCGSCDSRRAGRRSCDACGSRGGSQGRRGSCGGDCGAQGRGPARRQAYLLWNDGSGWQQREVDAEGAVAHGGHEHAAPADMIFRGGGTDAAPELTRGGGRRVGHRTAGGDRRRHPGPRPAPAGPARTDPPGRARERAEGARGPRPRRAPRAPEARVRRLPQAGRLQGRRLQGRRQ